MMLSKNLKFGNESRDALLKGANLVADAVKSTLGPGGRNVILDRPDTALITKDGVSIAREIYLEDRFENMGARLLADAATKTNIVAGDGTTTSTVLAQAILNEGYKHIVAKRNPVELKKGIDLAIKHVIDYIDEVSKKISDNDDIKDVATISANGEESIGKLVANAIQEAGAEGIISVDINNDIDDTIEFTSGMRFDKGYLSGAFVNDQQKQMTVYEDVIVILSNKQINDIRQLTGILTAIKKDSELSNKGILLISDKIEGEALASLVLNYTQGHINIVAVEAPEIISELRVDVMTDIAALTGATYLREELGLQIEKASLSDLGYAKRVEITRNQTIIVDGCGDKEEVEKRIDCIKHQIDNPDTTEFYKAKAFERLAKLTGVVANIKVGAPTLVELNERKDRVIDALSAARCAATTGILPGGGSTLLYASEHLNKLSDTISFNNDDCEAGFNVVIESLKQPINQICINAGVSADIVINKLIEGELNTSLGYDARNHVYCDMFDNGIIDPVKVVKSALINAASVASTMLTANVSVGVILPKEYKTPAPTNDIM